MTMDTIKNSQLLLPNDLVSYENDNFCSFVRVFLGDNETEIFLVQYIKMFYCYCLYQMLFSFFDREREDLLDLKKRVCFIIDNTHFVVKPGIIFNIEHFIRLVRANNLVYLNNYNTVSLPEIHQRYKPKFRYN